MKKKFIYSDSPVALFINLSGLNSSGSLKYFGYLPFTKVEIYFKGFEN